MQLFAPETGFRPGFFALVLFRGGLGFLGLGHAFLFFQHFLLGFFFLATLFFQARAFLGQFGFAAGLFVLAASLFLARFFLGFQACFLFGPLAGFFGFAPLAFLFFTLAFGFFQNADGFLAIAFDLIINFNRFGHQLFLFLDFDVDGFGLGASAGAAGHFQGASSFALEHHLFLWRQVFLVLAMAAAQVIQQFTLVIIADRGVFVGDFDAGILELFQQCFHWHMQHFGHLFYGYFRHACLSWVSCFCVIFCGGGVRVTPAYSNQCWRACIISSPAFSSSRSLISVSSSTASSARSSRVSMPLAASW